jgi:hypothetical protein
MPLLDLPVLKVRSDLPVISVPSVRKGLPVTWFEARKAPKA